MEPAIQQPRPTATAGILERFCDPGFWRRLNPQLAIAAASGPEAGVALDDEQRQRLRDDARHGRDFAVAGVIPRARLAALGLAIERLHAIKCPSVFVFVYDEPWRICAAASPIVETVLGGAHALVPDLWAWRVASTPGSGAPNRLRGPRWLYDQAPPRSLTLWIPLDDGASPSAPQRDGSVRGWAHDVHRWGTRVGRSRPQPSTSFACDFGRADRIAGGGPRRDPRVPPPFSVRLALIGQQVLQHRAAYAMSSQLLELAGRLAVFA